jgi:O-antigen ligase
MRDAGGPSGSVAASPLARLGLPRFRLTLTLLGLCVFTFAVVSYYWPVGELGVAIAAVGLFLQVGKVSIRVPYPVLLYFAFVLWAYIASLASSYHVIVLDTAFEHLKLVAIMLIVVNALRTEGQIRFYLLFFLGCFVLFPLRGTLVGGNTIAGRALWNYIYSSPNDLAALSLIALGVALGMLFSKPPYTLVHLGAAITSILLLVVILLTQSRGAFLGLVAGMAPAALWSVVKRPVRMALLAGVVVLVVGQTVPPSTWERLSGIAQLTSTSTVAQADPEGSAAERFEIQKTGWQIFLDHPISGVGLGAFPDAVARYNPELGKKDTHNTYLNLAAELGLPGLLIWCALVWLVLRRSYRSRQLAGRTNLSIQQAWIERAFWAYLVAGMFGTYARLSFPYLILSVLWCSTSLLNCASATESDPRNTSV